MSHKPKTVLVVDDDEGMRDTLTAILKREYRILRVSSGEAALPVLHRDNVDLMLLDVRLPGISGFEVLRIVKENYGLIEVIMISAVNDIETAVQAMKHGAYHYITKDFDYDQLRSLVGNASERQDLNRQVLTLSAQVADQAEREFIVGPSKATRDIVDLVQKVAKLSAIQEGEIERVGGNKPIKTEFRLIAATNVDLEKAVKDGRFREDLYYRINVIPIKLPPLRERAEDVPQLVEFFLRRYSTRFRKSIQGLTDPTMRILKNYWWPGNIRELENLIERLVAMSDKDYIAEEDLPLEFHFAQLEPEGSRGPNLFEDATNTFERNFILRALEKCGWTVTATAEYLGIPLSTLKYKMDKLDVRQLAKRLRGA